MSRVAVLGAGSFGTTLAVHLAQAGHEARLWGRDRAELERVGRERENAKFLAGIHLPDGVKVQPELGAALDQADFVLFVVPTQATRGMAEQVAALGCRAVPVCASKGLELGTLRRLSQVLAEALGDERPVTLTGPSHAEEVARGIPTTVVAASSDESRARAVQVLFSTPRFRVYTNDDVIGCEYGGALKNVIAIAAGVCDGLGFGDNTEMSRLGETMGARRETFSGLTGMGDLIATAMSRHSRNRHVGEQLGRGEPLQSILGHMHMVAEGVTTARAARDLGRQRGVELPITEQVCELFEGRDPMQALLALMTRDLKREA
jgi:glycerol-3-phosphate dehydrogenase (NAD(P)+)